MLFFSYILELWDLELVSATSWHGKGFSSILLVFKGVKSKECVVRTALNDSANQNQTATSI